MEEKNDFDKIDEVMLPGFRFHPTDEELVGFYLRRKIQQRPLPIELIKQLDIYKYDPWDLPKLATTGEKEWYFYCPRDRKYRNSARPNRVTRAGFWKATGTDRPIYSSEGSKCIGLKKSLVFYKGRAARGIKTDWMMHEFRLPSYTDPSHPPKKTTDKNLPPNDSWAICRIFKKTNSIAQRALSHSWVSPSSEIIGSDLFIHGAQNTHFSSENISCASEARSAIQASHNNSNMQQSSATSFFPIDVSTYQSINPTLCKPSLPSASNRDLPTGFMFSPIDLPVTAKGNMDTTSFLANLSPAFLGEISKVSENMDFTGVQQQFNGFSFSSAHELPGNTNAEEEKTCSRKNPSASLINNHNGNARSVSFPFSLPVETHDAWRPSLSWDSPPCPSEMSTSYSTNKCYT